MKKVQETLNQNVPAAQNRPPQEPSEQEAGLERPKNTRKVTIRKVKEGAGQQGQEPGQLPRSGKGLVDPARHHHHSVASGHDGITDDVRVKAVKVRVRKPEAAGGHVARR